MKSGKATYLFHTCVFAPNPDLYLDVGISQPAIRTGKTSFGCVEIYC